MARFTSIELLSRVVPLLWIRFHHEFSPRVSIEKLTAWNESHRIAREVGLVDVAIFSVRSDIAFLKVLK